MDFFGAQHHARRKTWRLALLFGAAVASLVVLTNVLIGAVYTWTAQPGPSGGMNLGGSLGELPVGFWVAVSSGVVAVVALASLYKYLQVRGGGRVIAESLGGHPLQPATGDFAERRLLNVVEEMAIASGTPVPPVYIIEEPSINAFAAGFSPDDAVIGVNRGTLEHLNREELQGVIAHEFSHILNGDSRLNLRLIAVLHGILFIGLVGRGLLHGLSRGHRTRSNSSAGVPGLALGLGFALIGYAGTFFGNLIKAAVSRQREFLADAASVQFTRNPGGIAGALKKIGGLGAGSAIPGAAAHEASHLFFGQPGRVFLNALMTTHPPLERRIRAVDPRWDGRYPVLAAGMPGAARTDPGAMAFASAVDPDSPARVTPGADDALHVAPSPDAVVASVGQLDDQGLAAARTLIDGLPERLRDAAHDPFDARALLYAMVLDSTPPLRGQQLELLDTRAERGVPDVVRSLAPLLEAVDAQRKLTLLELSIPALKTLSAAQYRTFVENLVALIKADRRIDLMEWVLHRLLVKELRPHFESQRPPRARHGRISEVAAEAAVLLSALARESGSATAAAAAFGAGRDALGLPDLALDDSEDPNFARLNGALAELRLLKPLEMPKLIKACAAAILAEGTASARQHVLLQGVAATLDCPLPPTFRETISV